MDRAVASSRVACTSILILSVVAACNAERRCSRSCRSVESQSSLVSRICSALERCDSTCWSVLNVMSWNCEYLTVGHRLVDSERRDRATLAGDQNGGGQTEWENSARPRLFARIGIRARAASGLQSACQTARKYQGPPVLQLTHQGQFLADYGWDHRPSFTDRRLGSWTRLRISTSQ